MQEEHLAVELSKGIVRWYENWNREYTQAQIDVLG